MTWRTIWLAKIGCFAAVSQSGSRRPNQRYRTRLLLEPLEDRCVPTTITPTTFADDGALGSGSLRAAVLLANADTGTDDDTIQLAAGTYALTIQNAGGHHETGGLTGDLNITNTLHRLIIQGAGSSGSDATIIDASVMHDRAFQIVNSGTQVVFKDLVIQGGLAQDDGSDGALAGSTDALGGGILNNGGTVTLDHVLLQNNVTRAGDVVALSTPGHNGNGGGIYSTGGALSMTGATIANNQAIGGRGGDHNGFDRAGDGGSAGGGGLCATGGSLDIANSTIGSNEATGGRGGDGYVGHTIFETSRYGGTGGGVLGGGLYVSGASLTIASSTIASNQATGGPGGAYGHFGFGYGGGLYSAGTLTVSDSTLSGNSASDYGGGIYNFGTLTVTNSTLSGNFATNSIFGRGGGIGSYRTLTLTSVTITANRAYDGGGLYVDFVSPVLHNTLIAGNFRGPTSTTTRDEVSGALNPAGDYNLIGDGTGMTGLTNGVNGNLVGSAAAPIDPLLGPLQGNGGPTKTQALLAGSPALNAGDPAQLGVADQRGVVRAGGVNIGAYQASASAFVVTAPVSVTAGTAFDVTVKAVDTFAQTAVGYRGTAHFGSSDSQAVKPGDYTFTAGDGGQHTFANGFTLKTAGNQTVTATDTVTGSLTGSATASVNPAAADHLLFLQQPTDTAAGQTISAVVIEIVDQFANVVSSDNSDMVTLSIGTNPTGGTLSGTLTVTVVNGVATFSDLSIDLVGDGYILQASASGLTSADSDPFSITT
jgi:hypothetical protein